MIVLHLHHASGRDFLLLRRARPEAVEWDTADIHRFLREAVPLLE